MFLLSDPSVWDVKFSRHGINKSYEKWIKESWKKIRGFSVPTSWSTARVESWRDRIEKEDETGLQHEMDENFICGNFTKNHEAKYGKYDNSVEKQV